jgi:hypothetical protein
MTGRLRYFGGTLQIYSDPNGTVVTAGFPVERIESPGQLDCVSISRPAPAEAADKIVCVLMYAGVHSPQIEDTGFDLVRGPVKTNQPPLFRSILPPASSPLIALRPGHRQTKARKEGPLQIF